MNPFVPTDITEPVLYRVELMHGDRCIGHASAANPLHMPGIERQTASLCTAAHPEQRDARESFVLVSATDIRMHSTEPDFVEMTLLGRVNDLPRKPGEREGVPALVKRGGVETLENIARQ